MDAVERATLLEEVEGFNKLRAYAEVLALMRNQPVEVRKTEPLLGYYFAVALQQTGSEIEAHQVIEQVELVAGLHRGDFLHRRVRNLQGMLAIGSGDLTAAESYLAEAFEAAHESGDRVLAALAVAHQGIVADIRCDWTKALACYHRSKFYWETGGSFFYLGLCQHNLGMTFRQLQLMEQADASLCEAIRTFMRYGQPDDVCATEIERALLACIQGDLTFAKAMICRALERADRTKHRKLQGEALRVLGMVQFESGDLKGARVSLRRSVRLARSLRTKMLWAEANETMAFVDMASGRTKAAERRRQLAIAVYRQMGATVRADRVGGPREMVHSSAM
ncbi:hypothetical protein BH23GEM6_BH23GEM6_16260 [soil metagenome]